MSTIRASRILKSSCVKNKGVTASCSSDGIGGLSFPSGVAPLLAVPPLSTLPLRSAFACRFVPELLPPPVAPARDEEEEWVNA